MLQDKHYGLGCGSMMETEEYEAYKPAKHMGPSMMPEASCGCGHPMHGMMPETVGYSHPMHHSMMPEMRCPEMGCCSPRCMTQPICEPPRERCVTKCVVHEVPHICPVNTRIITNHIFKHTYSPMYTCCEQNVVSNVQEGSCCNY